MARAVLPRMSASDVWLLTGHSASVPSSDGRNCPLDLGGSAVAAGGDENASEGSGDEADPEERHAGEMDGDVET